MRHTVKQLAKISGVSVRTLHWYDEIGLLKPAYYHINGYRYYEDGQLLQLQQILFFRELGFKLNDVQKLLSDSDVDKIEALWVRKMVLEKTLIRTKRTIHTIDRTIHHLQGDRVTPDQEFYSTLLQEDCADYEGPIVKEYDEVAEELIHDSSKPETNWDDKE